MTAGFRRVGAVLALLAMFNRALAESIPRAPITPPALAGVTV